MPRRPTLGRQVHGALWEGVEASEEGWLGTEGGATLLETLRGKRVCQERTWTALFTSHAFPSQLRRWAAEAAGGRAAA